MSRPALRTPARYGLPDTDRVRDDLTLTGLWGADGPVAANEDVLAAVARTGRPELAVYGLARLHEADTNPAQLMEALRTQPRFRGRLLGLLGASTVLSEHLAAWPEDWHDLLPEAPAEELVSAEGMRRVLCAAVGVDPDEPPCTGSTGARARITGAKAIAALRRAYRSQLLIIAAHDLARRSRLRCRRPRCPRSARRLPRWRTPRCRSGCRSPRPRPRRRSRSGSPSSRWARPGPRSSTTSPTST